MCVREEEEAATNISHSIDQFPHAEQDLILRICKRCYLGTDHQQTDKSSQGRRESHPHSLLLLSPEQWGSRQEHGQMVWLESFTKAPSHRGLSVPPQCRIWRIAFKITWWCSSRFVWFRRKNRSNNAIYNCSTAWGKFLCKNCFDIKKKFDFCWRVVWRMVW